MNCRYFLQIPEESTHVVYKAVCNKDQMLKKEFSEVYSKNFKTPHVLAIVKVYAKLGKTFMKKIAEKLLFSRLLLITESCFVAQRRITIMTKF